MILRFHGFVLLWCHDFVICWNQISFSHISVSTSTPCHLIYNILGIPLNLNCCEWKTLSTKFLNFVILCNFSVILRNCKIASCWSYVLFISNYTRNFRSILTVPPFIVLATAYHGFDSQSRRGCVTALSKYSLRFTLHSPESQSPINGQWRVASGKVTVGLESLWQCVTEFKISESDMCTAPLLQSEYSTLLFCKCTW